MSRLWRPLWNTYARLNRNWEKATPNKGGHRQKAIDLTKQAESQVEQGIQYYDQHVSPGPKKEKPKK
jgi:hypothetical protein